MPETKNHVTTIGQQAATNPPLPPLAYNIPAFCQVMGIGRSSTYEMMKSGELKVVRIAGRTLIPASEARRLLGEAA